MCDKIWYLGPLPTLSRPSRVHRPCDTSLSSESLVRRPRVAWFVVVRPLRRGSFVLVFLPGPWPPCQQLASAAVSCSCRLTFRFASESFSRFRPVGPPSDGSWRRGPLCHAREGLAFPACRVAQAQCCLSGVSRASCQYPWPPVAAAVSVLVRPSQSRQPSVPRLRGAPEVSVAGRQYPQATAAHRPLVAPKGKFLLQQRPGTCPRCVLNGSIRVGPSRTAISPSRRPRSVRLPCLVQRSRDRTSQQRHGVLRPHSIRARSSDRGVCGAGST